MKEHNMSSTNAITSNNTSPQRPAYLDEPPANDPSVTNTQATSAPLDAPSNRLVSDSPLFQGLPPPSLRNSQGTLVASRDFPTDAFVDTTTHPTFVPVGPYTYSREARLRESRDGVSVAADVKLTHSSDGRTLRVNSNVSYEDTSGKPIASVTVREYATVRGSDQTGRTWSVGGQGNGGPGGVGGGGTLGGGNTWINTTSGNVGAINLGNQTSNSRGSSGAVAINGDSRQFDYKYDVTVTYKDGTSTRVQVAGSTEPR
jgi:hypothetical protein